MMDDTLQYLAVNRQRGLSAELTGIANNIANLSTPGYRREGVAFSEFVVATGGGDSLSMADMNVRFSDARSGTVERTGGTYDLALVGEGFFQVASPGGPRLTRAGAFLRTADGLLATQSGAPVLDVSGAPVTIPADAGSVTVGQDGTISAGGRPVAQLAVVTARDLDLDRDGRTEFSSRGAVDPAQDYSVIQGALERSNVDAVHELARMIEVTRAYERMQSLIDGEDERVRSTLETLARL